MEVYVLTRNAYYMEVQVEQLFICITDGDIVQGGYMGVSIHQVE